MPELSPAARSVFESFNSKFDWVEDGVPGPQFKAIAAALRAAAEIVAPLVYEDVWTDGRILQYEKHDPIRDKLFAIADELESL
jgi:hypothetical protein